MEDTRQLIPYLVRGNRDSDWAPRGIVQLPDANTLGPEETRQVVKTLNLTYPGWKTTEYLYNLEFAEELIALANYYTPDGKEIDGDNGD